MTPFISYNIINLPKTYELLKYGKKSYIQKKKLLLLMLKVNN